MTTVRQLLDRKDRAVFSLRPEAPVLEAIRAMATAAAPTPVEAGTLDVSANVVLTVEVSPTAR